MEKKMGNQFLKEWLLWAEGTHGKARGSAEHGSRSIALTSSMLATFLCLLSIASAAPADGPLILETQGTFYVGGGVEFRDPNTSSTTPDPRSLPGNIAVHQMHVEYQVPELFKYKYPIVFMHGGGHTGVF